MICKQCGGEIPEGGKFCPDCGTPVSQKTVAQKKPAQSAHTARPLVDNPYQPPRASAHPVTPTHAPSLSKVTDPEDTAPEDEELVDVPVDAPVVEPVVEPVAPPKPRPRPRPKSAAEIKPQPDLESTPASHFSQPSESGASFPLPHASARSAENPVPGDEGGARLGAEEKVPPFGADKPTIAPQPKNARRPSTMVPKRILPTEDDEMDNFFEDVEEDEDAGEQTFLERNLRSVITFGLLALTLVVALCWLMVSSSGKVFMAGLGITRDAHAYKLLGDQYVDSDQPRSASNAYYQALKYDPDNYDYALLSATAFYAAGEKELAAKAAQLAIELEPGQKAPYELLAEMFPVTARPGNIGKILEDGAKRFSDPSLTQ